MKVLYDIFFLLFSLVYLPVLFFKGKMHPHFAQRFGFLPENVKNADSPVWIHAVSVGEAGLAVKLARSIKEKDPQRGVIISTTTTTGNQMALKKGGDRVDAVFFYPLDISFIVSAVIEKIDPAYYLVIETELWPNMLRAMRERGVPTAVVNSRISDGSYRNYRMFAPITRGITENVGLFLAQSEIDASRLRELGVPAGRVSVTGNMKFDEVSGEASKRYSAAQLGFKEGTPLLVAGSTHYPEESLITDVVAGIKEDVPGLGLVIVPRHPERSREVKEYAEKKGFKTFLFSSLKDGDVSGGGDVLVVDTIGYLRDIYSASTVVFIGGSIGKRGGQNPIEAAMWGKPVIFGPNMSNFREISSCFLRKGAALQVSGVRELELALKSLLSDPEKRNRMSRAATEVISYNKGATDRVVEIVLGHPVFREN
jgi:3-deoxy-D-manno-octulosonic-acid transferase